MHDAPAVSYPAGRSFFALAAILVLWLLGATGIALWSVRAPVAPLHLAIVWGAVIATGAIALRSWFRSPAGTLSWNGQGWTWTRVNSGSDAGTPEAVLDAQHRLLLRWRGAGIVQWLWLERSARPAAWDDLRRAVYSRARPEGLPGAQPSGEAKP
jgi:hypothetical protein